MSKSDELDASGQPRNSDGSNDKHGEQLNKPNRPYTAFPLFAHANGQWAKKINGKLAYFGVWNDPDAALAKYQLVAPKKPSKPYEGFPLFAHPTGRWAKKINYKTVYFAKWDDPYEALKQYRVLTGDLDPQEAYPNQLTMPQGIELHLDAIKKQVSNKEISQRTWDDRELIGRSLTDYFGQRVIDDLRPLDWLGFRDFIAKDCKAVTLLNRITRCKTIFKWLSDNEFIKLPRYGTAMRRPANRFIRFEQHQFDRSLSAEEIRLLIDRAEVYFRPMIHLGINCGLGNLECARLEHKHLDLQNGWLRYPREKTGILRRAKLWPETIDAIQEWIKVRPESDRKSLFITRYRKDWSNNGTKNSIAQKFGRMLVELDIHREKVGFYSLRRMTETIGGRCKDQVAVGHVMGHYDSSMAAIYRQGIDDYRLEAVADEIRRWLQPELINYPRPDAA